jgi:uncharacterized protein related to proFAR isomerase
LKIERHAYSDYPCRQLSEKIIINSFKNIVNIIKNYKENLKNSYIIYTEDIDFLDGQGKNLEIVILFNIDGVGKVISAWREHSPPPWQMLFASKGN